MNVMATHSAARWAEALGVGIAKVVSSPPRADDEGRWRVLKRDVLRTRATDAHYSTSATQQQMTEFLVRFCSENACDYRQGLNELVAPFVAPALSGAPEERYACFAAFVLRFAGKPMVGAAGCEDTPLGEEGVGPADPSTIAKRTDQSEGRILRACIHQPIRSARCIILTRG